MIYDGEDGIFSIPEGKSRDQIHGYLLKRLSIRRDHDAVKWSFLSVSDNFVLLTNSTAFDIISNPIVHCWPLIDLFCFSDCFVLAWVSGCHVIMSICHDGS